MSRASRREISVASLPGSIPADPWNRSGRPVGFEGPEAPRAKLAVPQAQTLPPPLRVEGRRWVRSGAFPIPRARQDITRGPGADSARSRGEAIRLGARDLELPGPYSAETSGSRRRRSAASQRAMTRRAAGLVANPAPGLNLGRSRTCSMSYKRSRSPLRAVRARPGEGCAGRSPGCHRVGGVAEKNCSGEASSQSLLCFGSCRAVCGPLSPRRGFGSAWDRRV